MLYSVNDLSGYEISATDGNIGHVRGFYFDPQSWNIHYLVVDTREWLPGRKVLISLVALGKLDARNRLLPISLSKQQIKDGPPVEDDAPITSLQDLNAHHGWQFSLCGDMPSRCIEPAEAGSGGGEDVELRNTREMIGFYVKARDGHVGHVEDFIVDDEEWTVRYMVTDGRNRLLGRKALIPLSWADEIGWTIKEVYVAPTLDAIKDSPEYDPLSLPDTEYEQELAEYFRKPLELKYGRARGTQGAEPMEGLQEVII
jgi:sporulation protein YlmC with PRC-barrel domain